MRIHLDLPNYDSAEGAAHKLRLMKNAARRLQLEIEQMERQTERRGKKEQRLALFRDRQIATRPRDKNPAGGSAHRSGSRTVQLPRRKDRFSLGRAARPSELRDPPSREEGLRIARLRVGDSAWVRRSGDGWTYAVVKERGKASLTFMVNKRGSTKTCPLADWHKYVRAVEKVPDKASSEDDGHPNRPAGNKAEKDKSLFERSLVLREWDETDGSEHGHDRCDKTSSSSSACWSCAMELKEDGLNEVFLQDNEVSMYCLSDGLRSSAVKVIQDHELSTFALSGDDRCGNGPPVRQARRRPGTTSIPKFHHLVGSSDNAIDAPTNPASTGEVKQALFSSHYRPRSALQNLGQSKPSTPQIPETGEAVEIKEGTETDTEMQHQSFSPPRSPQQEESNEVPTLDEMEEDDARSEATETHPAEEERPQINGPSGARVLPRLARRRSHSLPPMLPSSTSPPTLLSPILEHKGPGRLATRRPTCRRRCSKLVKQQSFNSALKRIHGLSSSSARVTVNLAYC